MHWGNTLFGPGHAFVHSSQWTNDEINNLKSHRPPLGIIEEVPGDHLSRMDIDLPLPKDVQAIIAAFAGFEIFPMDIFRKFYFRDVDLSIHQNLIIARFGKCYLYIHSDYIRIELDQLRFHYDNQQLNTYDNRRKSDIRLVDGKFKFSAETQIPYKLLPKIPLEVIERFDPNNEFGLRRIFKSILTTESYQQVINNFDLQNWIGSNFKI